MNEKNLGNTISKLRKEKNMTQQELAEKLNITDKAVSKWERGLSYPDITSISKLAKILDVDSSYLIDLCKKEESKNPYQNKEEKEKLINFILLIIPFSLSIASLVLSFLNKLEIKDAQTFITLSILCISIYLLKNKNNN